MNVRRGPEGTGGVAVKCSTCHQDHNLSGSHTSGRARLASSEPGHADDLGRPHRIGSSVNYSRTLRRTAVVTVDGIVEHMKTPLVLWGWNPGNGRTPVPISEAVFLENVKEWAAKGAACPGGSLGPPR